MTKGHEGSCRHVCFVFEMTRAPRHFLLGIGHLDDPFQVPEGHTQTNKPSNHPNQTRGAYSVCRVSYQNPRSRSAEPNQCFFFMIGQGHQGNFSLRTNYKCLPEQFKGFKANTRGHGGKRRPAVCFVFEMPMEKALQKPC